MQFGLFGGARTKRSVGLEDSQGYESFIDYVTEADRLGLKQLFMVEHHFTGQGQVSASMTVLAYLAARTSRSIPCAITLWFCGEPSSRAPGRDFVAANARDNGSWRDHVGLQHRALQKITRLPSYGTFYRPRARKVLRLLENGSSDSTKSILWFTSISRIARVRSYGGDLLGQRLAGGSGCARGPQIRAGN